MPIGILGTNLWNLFLYRRGVSNPFIPCIPPNPDFRDLSAKRKFLAFRQFHLLPAVAINAVLLQKRPAIRQDQTPHHQSKAAAIFHTA